MHCQACKSGVLYTISGRRPFFRRTSWILSFDFSLSALPFSVAGVFIRRIFEMTDPNPWPHVDYGRNTNRADVLIIGAGISGMVTAIDMIRKGNGRNFIIVEKGNQVGGTWNDQRYPGCCCDSRSPFPLS